MNTRNIDNARYRLIKAGERGESVFVDITDDHAIESVRNTYGNHNLLVSPCYYTAADPSAPRIYPLRFHIACRDLEQARISTLGAGYHINQVFCISLDCLEIVLASVGDIADHAADDGNHADNNNHQTGHIIGRDSSDLSRQDKDIGSHCAGKNDKTGKNSGNNRGLAKPSDQRDGKGSVYIAAGSTSAGGNGRITGTDVTGAATAAEIIIIVPPIALGGKSALPAINYQLARKMAEDGIANIDVDVYQQNHFIPLVNSIRGSRHVTGLTMKELLYLDAGGISELTKNPRPEDSLIMPQFIPEAAERFAGTCAEFEKKHCQQDKLRALILKNWQIPPCIRRLSWADLAEDAALEACRVISGTYPFLGSHEDEIWFHILRLARRNSIQGVRGHQRLRAIITFALENPMLSECSHPLVRQFCPAGGCYISGLLEECRQPGLFEGISKACTQL